MKTSQQLVLPHRTYLGLVLPGLSVAGSGPRRPGACSLGGGVLSPRPHTHAGLAHVPAPLPPQRLSSATIPGQVQSPAWPNPPHFNQWALQALAPSCPVLVPVHPPCLPGRHRSRIQHAGAHYCAPAASPTRPICLGEPTGPLSCQQSFGSVEPPAPQETQEYLEFDGGTLGLN